MSGLPFKKPRPQNKEGNLYVDESCIDCDVCRWMCPSVYARKGLKSYVFKQPVDDDEKLQAFAAMIACPVGSIRTYAPDPMAKFAIDVFPAEVRFFAKYLQYIILSLIVNSTIYYVL